MGRNHPLFVYEITRAESIKNKGTVRAERMTIETHMLAYSIFSCPKTRHRIGTVPYPATDGPVGIKPFNLSLPHNQTHTKKHTV